jgi:DNA-binding MarR family transcriptional regulator
MKTTEIQEFRKYLRTIERSVADQLKLQTECCGVTLSQCHTLVELGDTGEINLAGLAKRMELDASTLSRTVESMVKTGLIARDIDSSNRRAVVISLTKKGKQRLTIINKSCNEYYGRIMKLIPKKDRSLLLKGVELVAATLTTDGKTALKGSPCSRTKEVDHA